MLRIALYLAAQQLLSAATPEDRAITYLTKEVERWRPQNGCFSCHNNGDGARALFAAIEQGRSVDRDALRETNQFLERPPDWDQKKATEAFSDKQLARIQFAVAAAAGLQARVLHRNSALEAAKVLSQLQADDGSWRIETGDMPGAPATYGTALATSLSREALAIVDAARFAAQIASASAWLDKVDPQSVPDAAAVLLGRPKHTKAWAFLQRSQTPGGGWGPRLHSPAEAFDTAVALLALARIRSRKAETSIRLGRAYLIRVQQPEGGWVETTRPAGAQSYAQHISTSAWATLALLATDPERQ